MAQVTSATFNGECAERNVKAEEDITEVGKKKTKYRGDDSKDDGLDVEEEEEEEAPVNGETTIDNIRGTVGVGEMSMTEKPRESETIELDDLNDVFLVMDGRRLAASKVVLCLASPVFKSLVESSISHKQEIHLHGKIHSDVKEFYGCIDPRTMTPITDQNIYTVLPLIHEFKVECLLQRCQVFLPDKVNEFMDAQELCRHLHLAVHYGLLDLEVKCVSLCSELKLAEMVEWMSYYNIPDPVQLKVRDKSLHRHELEDSDTTIITKLYKHEKEVKNKDFAHLLCEELKQNHFSEAFRESSIKTSVSTPLRGTSVCVSTPAAIPHPVSKVPSTGLFGFSNVPTNQTLKNEQKSEGNLFGTSSRSGGLFGSSSGFGHFSVAERNDHESASGPLQVQSTPFVTSTATTPSCFATVAANRDTAGGFNFSIQIPGNQTNILKFLQGMRLFYKYLADTHSDMKRDVVQYMRSQMTKLSTKEREIFDLLPARAKHDVRGRLVKEIPDKN